MVSTVADVKSSPTVNATLKHQAAAIAQQMSNECVARRLRQVNRTVTRLYDEALRPHGLTVNQLNILAVVISERQIRPGQLGQSLGMEKSTVSRTVDRMVGKGWLKVLPGEDSRTQLIKVTPKGNKLLLTVTPIWDKLQANLMSSNGNSLLDMLSFQNADSDALYADDAYSDEPISAEEFYI